MEINQTQALAAIDKAVKKSEGPPVKSLGEHHLKTYILKIQSS
jgi:hypothetical protein